MIALAAAHHLITTFQAVVLGLLQGVTELFPISSLGHTVLFPTLFRWHNIVAWQSQTESPWLAVIGTCQSAALIAGISRDGVVMTGGLMRGLDNSDAARFGFFLATPPILAAGLLKLSDLTGPLGNGVRGPALIAAACSAVAAVITVHFLSKYFERGNLRPFAVYCLGFGAFMVAFTAIAGTP
jgi:undecaprenyl pyrophosphate phosphatase UppP